MKKKVLVVTGTRAEYGMLRSTMDAIQAHPELDLKLLVTGIHTLKTYGNTQEEIKKDGYVINSLVPVKAGSDMLESLAQEIVGIREYCLRERPDCVLVLGDRDEPLAAAIVAAHLNIPLAHIHGGDATGPGVDEGIRHAITKFAHIHFPGTEKSAARILSLGEKPNRIFSVGSVALDILATEQLPDRAHIAEELHVDAAHPWLTVVMHPTSFDSAPLDRQIGEVLRALETFTEHEKILLYPNTDTGSALFIQALQALSGARHHAFPSLMRPLFMGAVRESDALVGNSSAGIIETSLLGTPTVDVGNRQAGRERGESVIHVDYDAGDIASGIRKAIDLKRKQSGKPFASPYGSSGAGKKIADSLARELSRTDLLNKGSVT